MIKGQRSKYYYNDGALRQFGFWKTRWCISWYYYGGTMWFRILQFGLYFSRYKGKRFRVLYKYNYQ